MPPDISTGFGPNDPADFTKGRTGLVTLLFTDTVGSTALKQQLGDQTGAALFRKHHQLVRDLLGRFPTGQEIETAGDSFLITFSTPSDAVRFALLLQSSLRPWQEKAGIKLQDRIGIHVGEVVIEGTASPGEGAPPRELYGIQIDICSRVMSLADGGQVLMSRGAFDSARQVLKGEDFPGVGPLEWLNHGPYLLKGLDEPVEICEVRETGQLASGPPAGSEKAQRQVTPDAEPVLGWRPALGQLVPNTQWMLEKKLGEGGFGEVWLGRHQTMKERRVFKFCFRAERVRSLKREMTLFRLIKERIGDHPNIVSLREVYFDKPPFFVEMDYVEGQDLRSWSEACGGLAQVPLDLKLEIIAQVADALQAAHDAGVIHRDVKPANILIAGKGGVRSGGSIATQCETQGDRPVQAKLTDFGIGQVVSAEHLAGVTRAGFTMTLLGSESSSQTGTQLYMAPELLAGKPANTRSDIYSLGVVLYQLLVNDFTRPVTVDWAGKVQEPLLREDLARCFTGDLGERFGSAAELARNLRRFHERKAEQQRKEEEQAALQQAAYRRGMMRTAGIAAVIVALIAGLAVVALRQWKRASQTAESLHRHLYCSDMAVAWSAWENGDVRMTRELLTNQLARLRPEDDLRGFEWRYLWARSRPQELFVLPSGGYTAKYSPNGRTVAFGGHDGGKVTLWDVASRRVMNSIQVHTNSVWHIAFSPDGKLLATASRRDPDFRIWNAATGTLVMTLPATYQENMFVRFSRDGQRLVTIAGTPYQPIAAEVKIWDVSSGRELIKMPGLECWAWGADFSADGQFLVVPSGDGFLRVWNLSTGEVQLLGGHSGFSTGIRFSPDGKLLATGDETGTIIVWDWATRSVLRILSGHQGPINGIIISSDNQLIASASRDHTARLWDLQTGELLTRFLGHADRVWDLDFSPDDRTLVTAGDGIRFWSTVPNREGEILKRTEFGASNVGYSPDSRLVFLDEWATNRVTLWDLITKQVRQTLPGRDLVFTPDGRVLTLVEAQTNLAAYEKATMRHLGTISSSEMLIGSTAVSPDGKLLAMRRAGRPVIMGLEELKEIVHLPGGSGTPLVFSADSKKLYVQEQGGVRIWDASRWRPIRWLCDTNSGVWHLALSGDGALLATASGKTVRLWDLRTDAAAENPVLGQTPSDVRSLTFARDGKNVAAGTFDGAITIWNVPGRKEIGSFKTHRSVVWGVAFAPDGQSLISQSYDSTVRLWAVPQPGPNDGHR